jgi:hypothetical protein
MQKKIAELGIGWPQFADRFWGFYRFAAYVLPKIITIYFKTRLAARSRLAEARGADVIVEAPRL